MSMNDPLINALVIMRNNFINSKAILTNENIIDNRIISQIDELIKTLDMKIKAECSHEYVEDYIDVDPEQSRRISYCSKCYSCFPVE